MVLEMSKIIVLGDADTVLGFHLAGVVDARAVGEGAADADEAVGEALASPDAGILIITQETLAALSHKTKKVLAATAKPVVIEIPGKRAVEVPGQRISDLVKKAIGIELK